MAFRIGEYVVRGEIDNRLKGHVMGKIWIKGKTEPITLNLTGNCLRDIAGCRFDFECKDSVPMKNSSHLYPDQTGAVGDMTASRKVRVFQVPTEEAYDLKKAGKDVPEKIANCMYLEWYSEKNGRVVIETTDFTLTSLSVPVWRMTAEEDEEQRVSNLEEIGNFLNRIQTAIDERDEEWQPEEDEPMDEFAWEQELRESDKRTDKYGKLLKKYADHPDSERIIAREMGWDRLEDMLDADERGLFNEEREAMDIEDIPDLTPIAETEGKDWILDENGNPKHPLAKRAFEFSIGLMNSCKENAVEADEDVADMVFQTHMVSAKLAGALNGLAYDKNPDGGFVVAYLKRTLQYFDKAMGDMQKVEKNEILDADLIQNSRDELFSIREEILRLMREYREKI